MKCNEMYLGYLGGVVAIRREVRRFNGGGLTSGSISSSAPRDFDLLAAEGGVGSFPADILSLRFDFFL